MSIILTAARLAEKLHQGQRRKYTDRDYIEHPGRVAARLSRHVRTWAVLVAAAWLHDTREDCQITEKKLSDLLIAGMPLNGNTFIWMGNVAEIVGLVEQLTNPSKKFPKLPRVERKRMDRLHIKKASLGARLIKLADRTDNLNEMAGAPKDFIATYAGESEQLLKALKGTDKELESELSNAIERLRRA